MGQTSGAVAEDGGQSIATSMDNILCLHRKSTRNKEAVMKNDDSLVRGGCGHSAEEVKLSAGVCGFSLAAGAVVIALALLFG